MTSRVTSNRPGNRPRLQVPITYVDDVILATSKEAWTWVRLPEFSGGLPNGNAARDHVVRNSAGLAKLVTGRDDVRGHLRITNVPVKPDDWADAVVDRSARRGYPEAMRALMDHQVEYQLGGVETQVHLGISLGSIRRETLTTTARSDGSARASTALEHAAGVDGEILSVDDVTNRHARANAVRATLRSAMSATGATRQDVLDLVLNSTNPGMAPPRLFTCLPVDSGPGFRRFCSTTRSAYTTG